MRALDAIYATLKSIITLGIAIKAVGPFYPVCDASGVCQEKQMAYSGETCRALTYITGLEPWPPF